MNCKNCGHQLEEGLGYCNNCGAKVISERITLKQLRNDFFNDVLGLDNLFLRTIRTFAVAPYQVILDYVAGTRKRYINPFAFLAIVAAISTFVFNTFSEEYISRIDLTQDESMYEDIFAMINQGRDKNSAEYQQEYIEYRDSSIETSRNLYTLLLRYFNISVFLFTPVYALLAFLVFGSKPFNYGEHLLANAYLVAFGLLIGTLFFLASVAIHPSIYMYSSIITIAYYLISYKKIAELSIKGILFKFLKFILLSIGFLIVIGFVSVILGFLGALIYNKLS